MWKSGVSSLLFGTNDTYEWHENNLQTQPLFQKALKDAGFTLIRTFIPDGARDKAIDHRLQTIEACGATALIVLTNIRNWRFLQHLVDYCGGRCLVYEFGNEPDINGFSPAQYLHVWNRAIPQLRRINPDAMFIGPVTHNPAGDNDFMQEFLKGVKQSGVLPDAISYHCYPCWQLPREECAARAEHIGHSAATVRQWIKGILKKELPIGITEWNYDPANPPAAYGDDPDFIRDFTMQAIESMIQNKVSFACQFDAASYSGYGRLDMFDVHTNQPKPQYFAIRDTIAKYKPPITPEQKSGS